MQQQTIHGADLQQSTRNSHTSKLRRGAVGGAVLDGGLEFVFRRMENPDENMLVSVGAAGLTAAAWMYFAPIMWAKTAADVGSGITKMAVEAQRNQMGTMGLAGKANFGGNFQDNAFNATSRQRGLAAIQSTKMNARSFLGQEARALHRF